MKVLKFSASWCGPCKSLEQTLEKTDLGLPVESYDIDEQAELVQKYRVRTVPTLVLVDEDGKALKVLTGAHSPAVLQDWVNSK